MTQYLIAALLLNLGAMAGAIVTSTSIESRSAATVSISRFLIPLGTIAGFGAIALFIYDKGVVYGLLWWAGTSFLFAAICTRVMDGLSSMVGLVSIAVGSIIALVAFL